MFVDAAAAAVAAHTRSSFEGLISVAAKPHCHFAFEGGTGAEQVDLEWISESLVFFGDLQVTSFFFFFFRNCKCMTVSKSMIVAYILSRY